MKIVVIFLVTIVINYWRCFVMRYGVRRYRVQYSLRGNPRATGFAVINAPSMQYIRDNWCDICGGQAYVLRKIVAV